jgi:hypothetical protein
MNDGNVQRGSRVLTIGSAAGGTGGTTYVAENFNVDRPSKVIERTDEMDKPNGQDIYETFVTGSATLQLADGTTPEPRIGWQFAVTGLIKEGTPEADAVETFAISQVGRAETNGGEKKISVQFRKLINVTQE